MSFCIFAPVGATVTLCPRKGAVATKAGMGSFGKAAGRCQTVWSLLPPRMTNGFSKAFWHLLCSGWGVGDVGPSNAVEKGHPQSLLSDFKLEV